MSITRRLFLRHSAIAGATVAVTAPVVAAADPEKTPREQAMWHLRELERLIIENGGCETRIIAVADYFDGSGYHGVRGLSIHESRIRDDDDMFAPKGGEA